MKIFKILPPLAIGSLFLMALGFMFIIRNYNDFDILDNGEEVEVYIIDVPRKCGGSRSRAYFRFEYDGKTHNKRIKGEKYCETIVPNSFIKLKKDKNSNRFLYLDEGVKGEMIASIILFIMGLGCFIKGLKNKTNY